MKINFKRSLTAIALGLSTIPFSFYKLEGPFGLYGSLHDNSNYPIKLLDIESGSPNIYDNFFIYNRQTGYAITYCVCAITYSVFSSCIFSPNKSELISFFCGESEYGFKILNCLDYEYFGRTISLLPEDNQFYFVKEKSGLNLNGFTDHLKGQFLTSEALTMINVYVWKNGEKHSFEKALKNWFIDGKECDSIGHTIAKILKGAQDSDLKKDESAKDTYELSNILERIRRGITLDKEARDLLNKSKILAVYGVFKGDNDKNSIVWGLAEDINNPEKRFHWITDLKDDISNLIRSKPFLKKCSDYFKRRRLEG